MPDATLSQALKEAYASAPNGRVVYVTLELRHPNLTEPIRVVCDHDPIEAYLEDDAPLNPGEQVFFAAYAFDITKPDVTTAGIPTATLTIDNVGREIVAAIEQVLISTSPVEVTFREYISDDLSGPQNDPPLTMQIKEVTADTYRVTATLGWENYANKKFPTVAYASDVFKGLSA